MGNNSGTLQLTTTVHLQYGTTTSYGRTTAMQSKNGNSYQNVTANVSGLNANTTYHFRIVATNSAGTRRGSDRTFTTLSATGPPIITTNPATSDFSGRISEAVALPRKIPKIFQESLDAISRFTLKGRLR
jgi:hypothetical protein